MSNNNTIWWLCVDSNCTIAQSFVLLQTTNFYLFALGGRFLLWHLLFFFVYILFASQNFLPIFIVWKRWDYQYLNWEDLLSFTGDLPFIMILIFWLSCYKWQFALNVLFVFFITTQAVT